MHRSKNEERALLELRGFLDGIYADGKLKDEEIMWLDTWLRDATALRADPDAMDVLEVAQDALADGVITEEERADLDRVMTRVRENLESRAGQEESADTITAELMGLLRGISADQALVDDEVNRMRFWLRSASEWNHWPASEIRRRVERAMESGWVSVDERAELLAAAHRLIGGNPADSGAASGLPMQTDWSEWGLLVEGQRYCLTGQFASGSRVECEEVTRQAGAEIKKNVSGQVDYLVIGSLASAHWVQESFGRKVEKAMELNIPVIPEPIWKDVVGLR